ncbi:MAG: hypothetical protein FWJ90_13120, partial [Actinomadura sp.]
SLRDQVSRFARNLPSDAIAGAEVGAGLMHRLMQARSGNPLSDTPDTSHLTSTTSQRQQGRKARRDRTRSQQPAHHH